MPNLVALIQAQGVTRVLSLRFVDVLIIVFGPLMIPGIGFYLKRYTKTGDDFFLAGRQILQVYRGALGKWPRHLSKAYLLGWSPGRRLCDSEGRVLETMHPEVGRITIWSFIGLLVFAYGVLLLGAGLYEFFRNSAQTVVLINLHAGIWWGLLILILGSIHAHRFFPRKEGL